MKFTLEIDMDNAAFGEDYHDATYEIRRILQRLVHGEGLREPMNASTIERIRTIQDSNWNTCGQWTITREE